MSLTQVDFDIIMKKLDKFEEELKKLEKEIEDLKPRYTPWQSDDSTAPYYRPWKEELARGKTYRVPDTRNYLEQPEFLPDVLIINQEEKQ